MIPCGQWRTSLLQLSLSWTYPQTFDTVSHELLLSILREWFGINDVAINWYENYLKPRCFKVCINGKYSTQKTMDFSVPQGSIQGAYLSICYASTLNEIVPKSLTLNGFADDNSIRKSFKPTIPKTNSSSVHTDMRTTPSQSWRTPCSTLSHGWMLWCSSSMKPRQSSSTLVENISLPKHEGIP